ncbi:hypothetical protein [Alcanivorax sp. 1008]|uniref:hypothetical protein n=1 Tax=Alcanivorax sp. 1008 TaxID=2816853 RepID=UPI001D9F9181|nr:hypothetical protein [Alcanivorax sp. 1008]MCC1495340.1 hypothetical protein [Alcanivorax sp. 1008]
MKLPLILSAMLLTVSVAHAQVTVNGDSVAIEVAQQSLTTVLTGVAQQAGATIKVDSNVERLVSISIKNMPLQRAMDQIARQEGLNIVLGWRRDSEGNDHLASIDVLPDGNMDPASLAEQDARQQRILQQQQKTRRGGRAIPGGAEDKSWKPSMLKQMDPPPDRTLHSD